MNLDLETYSTVIFFLSGFGIFGGLIACANQGRIDKALLCWIIVMSFIFSLSFLYKEPRSVEVIYKECILNFNINSFTDDDDVKKAQDHCLSFAERQSKIESENNR